MTASGLGLMEGFISKKHEKYAGCGSYTEQTFRMKVKSIIENLLTKY